MNAKRENRSLWHDTMKAIQVRYVGPTDTRGSHFVAEAEGWLPVKEAFDYALHPKEQARNLAWAMWCANAYDAENYAMTQGGLPNDVHVFCFS